MAGIEGVPTDAIYTPESSPEVTETSPSLENAQTDSHKLATQDHELKGASQLDHDEIEVKDLGWNDKVENVPTPVVGGLPNEELWTLVRRFNKVRDILTMFSNIMNGEPCKQRSPTNSCASSKCTMSRKSRLLLLVASILTLPMKKSSRQISSGVISRDCT
jgi:Protein of unknown function (DUF3292)